MVTWRRLLGIKSRGKSRAPPRDILRKRSTLVLVDQFGPWREATFCTLTVKHVFFVPLKFTVRVKTCIYLFTKSRIRSKYFLYRTEQVYPTDFEDEGDKNK